MRDDFIIAIRSAFLKRSTQQKFSLLTLLLVSAFIIFLSSLDFKIIRYLKIGINEVVYRSAFVVSIPENFIKKTFFNISEYSSYYNKYKKNEKELDILKSKNISNEIIQFENKELKELINDYVSSSDEILAKIIVDHKSPFLKSIIINKGTKDNVKIGTNIYDQSYLVGRVIEANFKTSRVLLLSDLNSNVPTTIVPQNIQAIVTGDGADKGKIKYMRGELLDESTKESIVYTSGTGAIFKSGVPIGKLKIDKNNENQKFTVDFFSDFNQLKYVFAEVVTKTNIQTLDQDNIENSTPIESKLKILENEKKIIEDTNVKLLETNELLKIETNKQYNQILNLNELINTQKFAIDKFDLDKKELEYLRLNLVYSRKCQSRKLFSEGYKVGTPEYKKCILNKGKKINE